MLGVGTLGNRMLWRNRRSGSRRLRGRLRRRFFVSRVAVARLCAWIRLHRLLRALVFLLHRLLNTLASFFASLCARGGKVAVFCAV
jgi:hypothetical protein